MTDFLSKINEALSTIDKKWWQIIVLGFTGLLQGIFLFTLQNTVDASSIRLELLIFILATFFFFQFNYNNRHITRLIVISTTIGFMFAAAFNSNSHLFVGRGYFLDYYYLLLIIIAYILMPFIQTHHESNRINFPYTQLFLNAWSNVFIFLLACLFVGIFWLLLWLWLALFLVVGVDFFKTLFTSIPFVYLATCSAFSIGIGIARESKHAITMIRNIMLAMCKVFLPILIFIVPTYLITLIFVGFDNLWALQYPSLLLLGLVTAMIFFFNGIYQDGKSEPPYPKWLRTLLEIALLIMPIYAVCILYAISIRVIQYGLTTDRFWMIFLGVVAVCYTIGYAISCLMRKRQWMHFVSKVNTTLALVLMSALFLILTPILDPGLLSARNQYQRLASNSVDVEKFDYGYLYFKLNRIGKDYFKKIPEMQHPKQAIINKQLAKLRSFDSHQNWKEFQEQEKLFEEARKGNPIRIEQIYFDFLHKSGEAGEELLDKYLTLKEHPSYTTFKFKIEIARRKNKK